MKRLVMTAVLALCVAAPAFAADPVEGLWKTQPDNGKFGYVQIQPCSQKFCGILTKSFDKDGSPIQSDNIGKEIVIDMVPDGTGLYSGKVWRPANDKIYIGKLKLDGDHLAVDGCILGGMICSSQEWTRVKN